MERTIQNQRGFLKAELWEMRKAIQTDQEKKVPCPPLQKPAPEGAPLVELVPPTEFNVGHVPLVEAIRSRRSRREFTEDPLTLEELSFLLWATQGVEKVIRDGCASLRTVPSGGARHPFETYLVINRVVGITPGLYRYLPLDHKLLFLRTEPNLPAKVKEGCLGQDFVGHGAVVFIWTVIPYRAEWRYSVLAHKVIAIDAGHLCQNLYLACEAIAAGTCGIGSYHQREMDALLGVDGEDEFVIYLAPVGKVKTA
jgi:SagB-type dehydrogenase family enzyme